MTLEDYDGVKAVCERNGLRTVPFDVWSSLALSPPHLQRPELPIGWVIENAGRGLTGVFHNRLMAYCHRGQSIHAGVASGWAVDPECRLQGLDLLRRYTNQQGVDILINTTANVAAAKVFAAFGYHNHRRNDYKVYFRWILNFVAYYRFRSTGRLQSMVRSWHVRWRNLRKQQHRIGRGCRGATPLGSFDVRFDRFWERICPRDDSLVAVRDAANLAWHFNQALASDDAFALAIEEGREIAGYVVMKRFARRSFHYLLADLQSVPERTDLLAPLISAGLHEARRRGAIMVDAVEFMPLKRRAVESFLPMQCETATTPCLYRVVGDDMQLTDNTLWDLSYFDGDATLLS